MTYPSQLSEKVTPQRLDTMYGNFVKITDWLIKGKQSQHAMPAPFAALFDVVERSETLAELVQAQQATIVEQSNVIGGLQQRLAQQDGRIAALENTLQAVNQTLTQLVELSNAPAPAPAPVEATEDLPDLEVVIQPESVSSNEQAIQVSAAAVGAGNIDPASYAALDAEIDALLN